MQISMASRREIVRQVRFVGTDSTFRGITRRLRYVLRGLHGTRVDSATGTDWLKGDVWLRSSRLICIWNSMSLQILHCLFIVCLFGTPNKRHYIAFLFNESFKLASRVIEFRNSKLEAFFFNVEKKCSFLSVLKCLLNSHGTITVPWRSTKHVPGDTSVIKVEFWPSIGYFVRSLTPLIYYVKR